MLPLSARYKAEHTVVTRKDELHELVYVGLSKRWSGRVFCFEKRGTNTYVLLNPAGYAIEE